MFLKPFKALAKVVLPEAEKPNDCKHIWPTKPVCFFHDTVHRCEKCGYGLKVHIDFGKITIEEVHD